MKLPTILVLVGLLGLGVTLYARGRAGTGDEDHAQTTYFASGRLESRIELQDGKRHGRAERWYSNGTRMSDGTYENGRMEGDWFFWNPDGSNDPTRTGHYHEGALVTAATNEHADGPQTAEASGHGSRTGM